MNTQEDPKQESTQRREKTKSLLVEAALKVFADHGIAGASIEMITEEAGFTRGAFYSNFASKEELFLDVVDQQMSEAITLLGEGLAVLVEEFKTTSQQEFSAESISALISRIVPTQFTEVNWFVVLSEYRLIALRDPEVGARLLAAETRFNQRLTAVLVQALDTMGLKFTITAELGTELFVTVYQKALSSAIIENRPDIVGAARETAMSALPQLVNALIVSKE